MIKLNLFLQLFQSAKLRKQNCILRELAHELPSPLCSLFNQSLSLGIVPDIWKEAHVCPIPKGGDKTAVPTVGICSVFSCLLEEVGRLL